MKPACLAIIRLAAASVLCLTALGTSSHAQLARAWSFQPRPLAETEMFFVTEFGVGISPEVVGLQDRVWGPNFMLTWDAGVMRNVSPRVALGGTIGLTQGNNTDELSLALKPRFRYWASPRIPLDLSPGIVFFRNVDDYDPEARFLFDATISYRDWIGLTARILTTHIEYPDNSAFEPPHVVSFNKTDFYLGARLGAYPGLIAGSATAIAWIILESIFPDD